MRGVAGDTYMIRDTGRATTRAHPPHPLPTRPYYTANRPEQLVYSRGRRGCGRGDGALVAARPCFQQGANVGPSFPGDRKGRPYIQFYSLMPYSFQRLVTMFTTSGAMTISGGHGRGWPSSGILAVASKPIFQPNFSKGEEWSSASTGPSTSKVSRLGSTLLPTRKRTSCRFWTSTSSSTTMMNLESNISIMPQMALITFFAWPG